MPPKQRGAEPVLPFEPLETRSEGKDLERLSMTPVDLCVLKEFFFTQRLRAAYSPAEACSEAPWPSSTRTETDTPARTLSVTTQKFSNWASTRSSCW